MSAVSWESHLAGALTGLCLGIVVLKNRRVEKWQTWLKYVCVLLYTAAIIVTFLVAKSLDFVNLNIVILKKNGIGQCMKRKEREYLNFPKLIVLGIEKK